jgi:hypothetical protein
MVLDDFPPAFHLPRPFDDAVPVIPDAIVHVHAGADVVGNDGELISDFV